MTTSHQGWNFLSTRLAELRCKDFRASESRGPEICQQLVASETCWHFVFDSVKLNLTLLYYVRLLSCAQVGVMMSRSRLVWPFSSQSRIGQGVHWFQFSFQLQTWCQVRRQWHVLLFLCVAVCCCCYLDRKVHNTFPFVSNMIQYVSTSHEWFIRINVYIPTTFPVTAIIVRKSNLRAQPAFALD